MNLQNPVQCPECEAEIPKHLFDQHQIEYSKILYARKVFGVSEKNQKKIKKVKKLCFWLKLISWMSGIGCGIIFWSHIAYPGKNQKFHLGLLTFSFIIFCVCLAILTRLEDYPSSLFKKFRKEFEKK